MSGPESTIAGLSVSQSSLSAEKLEPTAAAGSQAVDLVPVIEEHIVPLLDPKFLRYFVDVVSKVKPAHDIPIQEVRANPQNYRPPCALDASKEPRVADYAVGSQDGATVPVRVYHPDPQAFGEGPYAVHLNYHGGGFVFGDLCTEAQLCLSMREAGVVVVDVNYRHCPETTWGKCIQDAWAALNWVRDSSSTLNINPTSVSIGGISAGAHICLVLQHMARDAGIPLRLCMASVPPSTDSLTYAYYTQSSFQSFHDFHRAPVLPWKRMQYFGRLCMPQETLPELRKLWPDWWFAPIRAPNWKGLCDTFVRTAEVDPLRDEGEAYGMKVVAGGGKVTFKRYQGCPHTFMYLSFLAQKDEYDRDAIIALRVAHGLEQ
ncbi:Alpha/Beta hydrolase protein [Lasiosphaeria miniovina]|uniref:Alpha/Beta hydrolase protein n=1 Tax=Lasiosphaeria miniovina TaxID=1954250 RepID=A0AA40BES9_9PEZI|nr:Alpha/Beta hydrolase protein [Lasiosphaeria miniovina]KAK0732895.1 Alpha/Beta hydrolase protein [Lasiosphaeria miniovina]